MVAPLPVGVAVPMAVAVEQIFVEECDTEFNCAAKWMPKVVLDDLIEERWPVGSLVYRNEQDAASFLLDAPRPEGDDRLE